MITKHTTSLFKSIAIVFLLAGHYCMFVLDGEQIFEYAGEWAVIIFIIFSAVGLVNTYGLEKVSPGFLLKRLKRIMLPLWFSLILFYLLEAALYGKGFGTVKVIMNFLGIIDKTSVNPVAWFVSFILYLYASFYLVSNIRVRKEVKLAALFLLCYAPLFVMKMSDFGDDMFSGWTTYMPVFPLTVLIMIYSGHVKETLDALFIRYRLLFVLAVVMFAVLFIILPRGKTFAFIGLTVMLSYCADRYFTGSKVTDFMNRYSYEIYLVHFPFIGYFSLPQSSNLLVMTAAYIAIILLISISLQIFSKRTLSLIEENIIRQPEKSF